MPIENSQRKHGSTRGLPRPREYRRTAMASRISRLATKSGCAWEWGAWGQLSEDGPGQHNPDRSEDPWGRAGEAARTEVLVSASVPDIERGLSDGSRGHEGRRQTSMLGRPRLIFRP